MVGENFEATETIARSSRSFVRFVAACAMECFALSIIAGSRGRMASLLADFDLPWSPMTWLALSACLPVVLVILVVVTVGADATDFRPIMIRPRT